MIIVYPNNIVFPRDLIDYLTKKLIYASISLPQTFFMDYILGEIVEEGPEGLVAKAMIVLFYIIL